MLNITLWYDILLVLFAASIPLGTRKLLVAGSDPYQSVFLYATDLLFVGLFLIWFCEDARKIARIKRVLAPLGVLAAWFLLASIFSQDLWLGLYRSLKLVEYAFVFIVVSTGFFARARKRYMYAALLAAGVLQSVLALAQFVFQRSFGLWWLGEQTLLPSLAGVAKLDAWGGKAIRAYGTFPHPNALAAFLLLSLFVAALLLQHEKKGSRPALLILTSVPFITLGFLLTFSRAVIAIGLVCLVAWLGTNWRKNLRFLIIFALSLALFAALLFLYRKGAPHLASFDAQSQSVALRALLVRNAFGLIHANPLLGTGPGQFTRAAAPIIRALHLAPWVNQPVHTIYLFLAAEAGLPALVFFVWFLYEVYITTPDSRAPWRFLLIAFFAVALTDHFFLTFQQGALLFWLTLGLAGK